MTVDFHAHTMPGVDHGCADVETAVCQLKLASEADIGALVAVSHFYPYSHEESDYVLRRTQAENQLKEICAADTALPKVFFGTEVALCRGLEKLRDIKKLCISGTNAILLEIPLGKWDHSLFSTIEAIIYDCGLAPVMAHIDRYPPRDVEKLMSLNVDAQVNLIGLCALRTRRRMLKWIERGRVCALGSDMHGTQRGYELLPKAKKVLGEDLFSSVMAKSCTILGL